MQKTTLSRIAVRAQEVAGDADGGAAVAISFTTVRGPSVRRQWDEWIVAGAFSRHLQTAGLPAEVDASDRAGSFTARPKLRGQPVPRPLRSSTWFGAFTRARARVRDNSVRARCAPACEPGDEAADADC
jgi:hypothetical protein